MLDPDVSVEIPFFIFFPERSGSTFLVHMLNAHPDVNCRHELFDNEVNRKKAALLPTMTQSMKSQILEDVYSNESARASGFKFKFDQFKTYPDVFRFLMRNASSMKLVFLYRRNLLKTAISRQNLSRLYASGKEYYIESESQHDVGKLVLNLPRARNYIRRASEQLELFREVSTIFENRIEVVYEDLLENQHKTLNQIFEFLGVGKLNQELDAPIRKITDDKLENAVSNFDEMKDFFQTTRFAEFLEPNRSKSL